MSEEVELPDSNVMKFIQASLSCSKALAKTSELLSVYVQSLSEEAMEKLERGKALPDSEVAEKMKIVQEGMELNKLVQQIGAVLQNNLHVNQELIEAMNAIQPIPKA